MSSHVSEVQQATPARTRYAVAGVLLQVLLGVVYSWSVFRGPMSKAYGWSNEQTIAPYRYSLLVLTLGMILGGLWQDRSGPRVVATAGGLLLGIGWLLAGVVGHNPAGLILAYGCLVGLGTGFAYVAPIATLLKWFPDKRGMMVGLAVMGVGISPLVFAPLLEAVLGSDPARFASTIPQAFFMIAAICLVGVVGAGQFCRTPPAGWRPAGWEPGPAAVQTRQHLPPRGMLATWQFYALWLLYFLGASVGLTAIGEASPLVREMAKTSAVLSGGVALGIMSVFNGFGRLAWGSVSDRMGRTRTVLVMCFCSAFACLFLLRQAANFWQLLAGLCLAAFAYGGYLALMPSLTADYYGAKHVGANYGLLFTAWGVCGFVVPRYFARLTDQAKAAGNLAAGYNNVYLTLAGMVVVCALVTLAMRPPGARSDTRG
jgi:MFS transporter, OFA family, oxalate/formate antiporter